MTSINYGEKSTIASLLCRELSTVQGEWDSDQKKK